MTEETVATNGTEPGASASPVPNTVSPTPQAAPDIDAIVKAAVEKTQREAQAAKDRELARTHQQYQAQLKAQRDQAVSRLKQAGDGNAENWDAEVQTFQKAQAYDAIQAEAAQWQVWNGYVADVAKAHGLEPKDKRLEGAVSSDELLAKAKRAMEEDTKAERERLLKAAQDDRRKAADAKVNSGELDTLGGTPAAVPENERLRAEYATKLKKAAGNVMAVTMLQKEYRQKGLAI